MSSLLTFSAVFFLQTVLCYGVALPTGLFVPGILCGAAYGRLVGVFVADLRPLVGSTSIDEGTYALLGAASFLGALRCLHPCYSPTESMLVGVLRHALLDKDVHACWYAVL